MIAISAPVVEFPLTGFQRVKLGCSRCGIRAGAAKWLSAGWRAQIAVVRPVGRGPVENYQHRTARRRGACSRDDYSYG